MPVFLTSDTRAHGVGAHPGVTVGVVNNMADEALKATERQYVSLLNAASEGFPVYLSFYTLPGIPRSPSIRRHLKTFYSNIDHLLDGRLDGLIVTGREPLAADLRDEAYWPSFTGMLEWAQENTYSTIWSCLAAHAAVFHMDGIERLRRQDKLFGVFDCECVSDHALVAGASSRMKLPHSRWNGLQEEVLTDRGYRVLTRGSETGVDTFIKQAKSLFVFFQGHPEYASDTLLREYRRDLGRYFTGATLNCPPMPRHYFDDDTMALLTRLQGVPEARDACLEQMLNALENSTAVNTWDSGAIGLYSRWLQYIGAQTTQIKQTEFTVSPDLVTYEAGT